MYIIIGLITSYEDGGLANSDGSNCSLNFSS